MIYNISKKKYKLYKKDVTKDKNNYVKPQFNKIKHYLFVIN